MQPCVRALPEDVYKRQIEDLPIIAMTADAFNEDVKRARRAGMNGHIAKPISIDQIKNIPVSYTHLDVYKRQGHVGGYAAKNRVVGG